MIIWFTGQPNSGKTTLSSHLLNHWRKLNKSVLWIDGDDLRTISKNIDYSIEGRKKNIELAQFFAQLSNKFVDFVIVSLVSPFREQREAFKLSNKNVIEIYLHSHRERKEKMVSFYEIPISNYLEIDTDNNTILQSVDIILEYLNNVKSV